MRLRQGVPKKAKRIWCSILIFPTNSMIMTNYDYDKDKGLLHVFPLSLFNLCYQAVLLKREIFKRT